MTWIGTFVSRPSQATVRNLGGKAQCDGVQTHYGWWVQGEVQTRARYNSCSTTASGPGRVGWTGLLTMGLLPL